MSTGPISAGIVGGMRVRAEVAARAQHRNAALPHGRQVRAAR